MIPRFSLSSIRSKLKKIENRNRSFKAVRVVPFSPSLTDSLINKDALIHQVESSSSPFVYHFYKPSGVISKSNKEYNITLKLWNFMIEELNEQYRGEGTDFFTNVDDHPNHIDPTKDIYDLPGGQFTVSTVLPINWWAEYLPYQSEVDCTHEPVGYSDIQGRKYKLGQNLRSGYNSDAWVSYCTTAFVNEESPYINVLPRRRVPSGLLYGVDSRWKRSRRDK